MKHYEEPLVRDGYTKVLWNCILQKKLQDSFGREEDSSQHQIENITSGKIIQLPENIFNIVSTGTDILVSYAAGENAEDGHTILGLKQVGTGGDIFTTEHQIELLQANEYFTVWTSYSNEYPVLYDNAHKQMLYLDGMDKAEHHYLLKDNYGLIETLIINPDGLAEY